MWLPLSLETGILTLLKSHAWQLECVRSMDQVTPHKGIRSFSHCETSLMSFCSCRLKKNNQTKIISFYFSSFSVWFLGLIWFGWAVFPPYFFKRRHSIQISPTFFLSSDLFHNLLNCQLLWHKKNGPFFRLKGNNLCFNEKIFDGCCRRMIIAPPQLVKTRANPSV